LTRPWPAGLVGQIVAILLVTMVVEFGVSTWLYERASQFSVRDDEARRLAEHLVISRALVARRVPAERPAMAADLTTRRYAIDWQPAGVQPATDAAFTDARSEVIEWEPSLADADVRMMRRPGATLGGVLSLPDGSWLGFRALPPLRDLDLSQGRILLALIPAMALMLIGGLLVRRTLRPMRRLAAAADRFGEGERAYVEEEGPSEVRHTVVAFNRMQARIERLIADRTQALAAVGHDLRTPLARLRLRAESVVDGDSREAIDRDLGEMEAMVASLMAFLGGDADPETPVLTDVAVLCATLVDDLEDRGLDGYYRGPDHCEMVVRPSSLKRALTNLVDNALHYAGSATLVVAPGSDAVAFTVEDDGPGIPEEQLKRVLDPFVRLDSARPRDTVGFGLGLPIVARIVEAEGGTLTLANRASGGLAATIRLPRRASATL
jgi:signal transduction histidine kinase